MGEADMGPKLLNRESGKVETCATVEKFDHAGSLSFYRHIANRVAAERYAAAELAVTADGCAHCEWTPLRGPDALNHDPGCPVHRFRPMPGGNWAATAEVRDLVERMYPEAMAFHPRDGVLDGRVKVNADRLRRLADDQHHYMLLEALRQGEVTLGAANVLLNEGINELWELVCFTSTTSAVRWDNTNARVGVGTSTQGALPGDTALIGTSSFQPMMSGFPTFGTSQLATWKSSYGSGQAEFAWQEWSVDNGNTRNRNLNRKQESLGTKPTGVTWTLQVQITLS